MNKDKILELLANVVEKDSDEIHNLNENAALVEIGLDSIKFIQFIVNMESEFDIEVNDSDLLMTQFETIAMIYKTMEKYFAPFVPLKKVLILDCDNVLWYGIAGEEEIYLNESILNFQKELVRLYENGVLLCLCSRNELHNIKEAFDMPDILIKWEHIVCAKINQTDKARNIREIAAELHLSTNSFVFADDSDYELGLVNALLHDVETVKVDYTVSVFIDTIKSFFANTSVLDLNRTKLYREQKDREKEKLRFDTVEEYNLSLETMCICKNASEDQINRIVELSQRTNQFNLSCKRYTVDEIRKIMSNAEYSILVLSITDKYGDMGIVGAAVLKMDKTTAVAESFMLSCRAFGRGFEFILLDKVKELANNLVLCGIYVGSDMNRRYARFFTENGVELYE